jgi:hypothetical protein
MIIAVVGGQDFKDYDLLKKTLNQIPNITKIITGDAKGADTLALKYAKTHNIEWKVIPADSKKHGKKAGMLRNPDIVKDAELVVAFWDLESHGTKDSIEHGYAMQKKVLIIKY